MVHFTGQPDQSYITLLTLPVLRDVCLTYVENGFNKHNMVIDCSFFIVTCTLRGCQEATGAKALIVHSEIS